MALSQSAVEHEALRSFNNLLESRVAGCVADRDLAVERRAKNEAILEAVMAILREHEVSAVPLVREKETPRNDDDKRTPSRRSWKSRPVNCASFR